MGRYALRLCLFCLPFAVLFSIPALVLWHSGEGVAPDRIPAAFTERPRACYGPAYSNPVACFKLALAGQRRAPILALGTSRVMQFRAEAFPGGGFTNAGGLVARIADFRAALGLLPTDARPRLLLVGLDQDFFNAARDAVSPSNLAKRTLPPAGTDTVVFNQWPAIWTDLLTGKIPWRLVVRSGPLEGWGVNAQLNGNGFRADGSYRYGTVMAAAEAGEDATRRFTDVLARIRSGTQGFEYGAAVNPAACTELGLFLDACATDGMHVIAFLPPYPHAIWQTLVGDPADQRYEYLRQLPAAIGPLLTARGFGFLDASDLATLGAGDDETVDGFHGSEKAYLRLLIRLARLDPALARAVDLPQLEARLSRTTHALAVWP